MLKHLRIRIVAVEMSRLLLVMLLLSIVGIIVGVQERLDRLIIELLLSGLLAAAVLLTAGRLTVDWMSHHSRYRVWLWWIILLGRVFVDSLLIVIESALLGCHIGGLRRTRDAATRVDWSLGEILSCGKSSLAALFLNPSLFDGLPERSDDDQLRGLGHVSLPIHSGLRLLKGGMLHILIERLEHVRLLLILLLRGLGNI